MRSRRLIWRIFPQVLILLVASLALIEFLSRSVNSRAVRWLVGAPALVTLSLAMSWVLSRSVGRSMRRMKEAAERLSSGTFGE